jgi:hypothetical protein
LKKVSYTPHLSAIGHYITNPFYLIYFSPIYNSRQSSTLPGQLFQFLPELRFGRGTNHLIHQLTIVKKEKSGDPADLVMTGRSRMQGSIQGGNMDPAQVFPAQPVNQRGQGLTGATGRRVKVNHHRQGGPAEKALELMVRQFNGLGISPKIKRGPAFTTLGTQMLAIGRDSVLAGAGWAGNDKGIHGSVPHARDFQKRSIDDMRKNASLRGPCQGVTVKQHSINRY